VILSVPFHGICTTSCIPTKDSIYESTTGKLSNLYHRNTGHEPSLNDQTSWPMWVISLAKEM